MSEVPIDPVTITPTAEPIKKRYPRRGFGSMNKDKQREIASKGGKAAHEKGTGHEWNSREARLAGKKGGINSRRRLAETTRQEAQQRGE